MVPYVSSNCCIVHTVNAVSGLDEKVAVRSKIYMSEMWMQDCRVTNQLSLGLFYFLITYFNDRTRTRRYLGYVCTASWAFKSYSHTQTTSQHSWSSRGGPQIKKGNSKCCSEVSFWCFTGDRCSIIWPTNTKWRRVAKCFQGGSCVYLCVCAHTINEYVKWSRTAIVYFLSKIANVCICLWSIQKAILYARMCHDSWPQTVNLTPGKYLAFDHSYLCDCLLEFDY